MLTPEDRPGREALRLLPSALCVARTQRALSRRPYPANPARGFRITFNDVRISAGGRVLVARPADTPTSRAAAKSPIRGRVRSMPDGTITASSSRLSADGPRVIYGTKS